MNRFFRPSRFNNQSGSIAILFAFGAIMVFVSIGFVIDIGRSHLMKRQTQNAVDSATSSAAQWYFNQLSSPTNTLTASQLKTATETRALHILDRNLRAAGIIVTNNSGNLLSQYQGRVNVAVRNDATLGKVLDISANLPADTVLFGSMTKWNHRDMASSDVSVKSSAMNSLEIEPMAAALAIDVSASMSCCSANSELGQAKSAAIKFTNHLAPGDYVSVNTFNRYYNHSSGKNLVLPMTKILASSGAGGKTVAQVQSIIQSNVVKFGPQGTYGQGGMYQARQEIETNLRSAMSQTMYDSYKKYILFASDGDFSGSSKVPVSGVVPLNTLCTYSYLSGILGDSTATASYSRFGGRAGTIEQADLARAAGIEVYSVCSRGYPCNSAPGEEYLIGETRQFMRRVAGDTAMISETRSNGHPWHRSNPSHNAQIEARCAYYAPAFSGTLGRRGYILGLGQSVAQLDTQLDVIGHKLDTSRRGKLIK